MNDDFEHKGSTIFHYLLSFFIITTLWIITGSSLTSYLYSQLGPNRFNCSPLLLYCIQHLNFLILFLLLLLYIHRVEKVSFLSFISDHPYFNYKGFLLGAGILLATQVAHTLISIVLFNTPFTLTKGPTFLCHTVMICTALVFTPLQCLSEELLFRSLFYNLAKRIGSSSHLISIISAFLFTLAHTSNVELTSSSTPYLILLYYFLSGFFFMEIVFAYKGIEVALGAHIMNNFYITSFVNYSNSSIHSIPFITMSNPSIYVDLLLLILSSSLLLFLSLHKKREC